VPRFVGRQDSDEQRKMVFEDHDSILDGDVGVVKPGTTGTDSASTDSGPTNVATKIAAIST
jgi:hypothetical protein